MSDSHKKSFWQLVGERSDRILLLGFIGTMAFVLVKSNEMGVGSITQPGPGLWPVIVSVATIAACIAALVIDRQKAEAFTAGGSLRVAVFVASAAVFVPVYDLIGFVPAGAITTFLIMTFVYRASWLSILIVTCTAPPAVYLMFGVALGVPLTAFG